LGDERVGRARAGEGAAAEIKRPEEAAGDEDVTCGAHRERLSVLIVRAAGALGPEIRAAVRPAAALVGDGGAVLGGGEHLTLARPKAPSLACLHAAVAKADSLGPRRAGVAGDRVAGHAGRRAPCPSAVLSAGSARCGRAARAAGAARRGRA